MGLDQYWYIEEDLSDEGDYVEETLYWRKCHAIHDQLVAQLKEKAPYDWNCQYVPITRHELTSFMFSVGASIDPTDYKTLEEVSSCVADLANMLSTCSEIDTFYYYSWW